MRPICFGEVLFDELLDGTAVLGDASVRGYAFESFGTPM